MKKITYTHLIVLAMLVLSFLPVFAQVPESTQLANPSGINSFPDLLEKIVQWLLVILAPILTIIILLGGVQMLTARDNEAQFAKGKKTVTYAAIGAAVILIADGIILVVKSFFIQ